MPAVTSSAGENGTGPPVPRSELQELQYKADQVTDEVHFLIRDDSTLQGFVTRSKI